MNTLILGSLIALGVLAIGLLIMALVVRFSRAVVENQAEIDRLTKEKKTVNPQATGGYPIAATAPVEDQLQQALQLAAKRAAALPRGANVGIQRAGLTDARANKKYASRGVADDPLTAVKIAQFHTWKGLTYTPPSAAPAPTRPAAPTARPSARPAAAPAPAAPAVTLIEITDDMSPAEKRKAIIANAKAQSAAAKAAKSVGGAAAAQTVEEIAPLGAPQARAQAVAAPPVGIAPPDLIAITDDMSPAEKRKAIIANAKAQSAYSKALKAAGYEPAAQGGAAEAGSAEPEPEPQPAPVAAAPASNVPPLPALTAITPDMAPTAIRQARINNAKALSAYRKQLKELGIDPASVVIEEP